MNIFATSLTYAAPSANYRGESELSRTVLQKVTRGRFEYAVISPEAIRNALREKLRFYGLESNRERLHNEDQLAVKFQKYPWPEKFVDDFLFGYLVTAKKKEREEIIATLKKERGENYEFAFHRDSIIRMNLAVALEPYRHDVLVSQSPQIKESPWKNAEESAVLSRELSFTAFHYPFALNLDDCLLDDPELGAQRKGWLRHLLRALSELNDVAGNAARSLFQMESASIVIRLTTRLAPGYDQYAFQPDGSCPDVVEGITKGDLPGSEFLIGGEIVRKVLSGEVQTALANHGVRTFRTAEAALDALTAKVAGQGFLESRAEG